MDLKDTIHKTYGFGLLGGWLNSSWWYFCRKINIQDWIWCEEITLIERNDVRLIGGLALIHGFERGRTMKNRRSIANGFSFINYFNPFNDVKCVKCKKLSYTKRDTCPFSTEKSHMWAGLTGAWKNFSVSNFLNFFNIKFILTTQKTRHFFSSAFIHFQFRFYSFVCFHLHETLNFSFAPCMKPAFRTWWSIH